MAGYTSVCSIIELSCLMGFTQLQHVYYIEFLSRYS